MEISNQKMAFIIAITLIILISLVMLFFLKCRKEQAIRKLEIKNKEEKSETNIEEAPQSPNGGTHPELTHNTDLEQEIERLIDSIKSNSVNQLDSLIKAIMEKIKSPKGILLSKKTRENLISRTQAEKTKVLQAVPLPAPKPNEQPSEEIKSGTRIRPPKI